MGWSQNFNEMLAGMSELSLPLINVEVDISLVTSNHYVPGNISLAEYKDNTVDTISYNCLVKYRGMLALTNHKKSFNIKLVDEEGEKLDANLLGLRTDNTWILDAMGFDKMRMRNRVCFDIWNEFSPTMWDTKHGNRNGTVGTMVEVFINGDYNGIYCLSDKINRELLNLRKAKVNDDGSVTVKGLLYKGNGTSMTNTLLDYDEDNTSDTEWNFFELQHPDEYPSLQTWQPLMDLIDFNSQTTIDYFSEHYNECYYVDNLVDYWVMLAAFGLQDMPYKNTFLSTPDINFDHRFMITPWDMDACLGRDWSGLESASYTSLNCLNRYGPFNRLLFYNIDGFKHKVAQRWFELTESHLSPTNVENHISAIAQRFVESGAWQREYERWKTSYKAAIRPNIHPEIQYAINWYRANLSYINDQIVAWREDYVEINTSTITKIYNYMLGFDTTFNEKIDLNKDGFINSTDVTEAYNFILGINRQKNAASW
ncbi:MAG: CotH kinase family protein [Muribaculaceae bacterium]|nr:CotH kinase family protein [Muribaculaceae bacterium]